MSVVRIFTFCTKGRDLNRFPADEHRNRAVLKPGFDHLIIPEDCLDLFRFCRCGDVCVVCFNPHYAVPDTASDKIGLKSGLRKYTQNGFCIFIYHIYHQLYRYSYQDYTLY